MTTNKKDMTTEQLDYTYSQLSSAAAAQLVDEHYNLGKVDNCLYYQLGLHDNYLVNSGQTKYILRIYRNNWRSGNDIRFELALLDYLAEKKAPVATALRTRQEELCFSIPSPEGERFAALFHYADGFTPEGELSTAVAFKLGTTVAEVHGLADGFQNPYPKQALDLSYLLDDSIQAIAPFLDANATAYLNALQQKIENEIPSLNNQAPVYGICLGDVNSSNFHINANKDITLFDFDQCGYGFRAFEIGKFNSSVHTASAKQAITKAFLKGYQDKRTLSADELKAIPYFEIAAVIWVMAIHAYNADRIGHKFLQEAFWLRRLSILKTLQRQLFT